MQTCSTCGTAYEGYACPNCGTASGQSQTRTCLGCGQQILASYSNCPHCGRAAETHQAPPPPPAQTSAYTPPPPTQTYTPPPPPPPGAGPVYAPVPPPVVKKSGPSKTMIVVLVVIIVVIASIAGALLLIGATNPFNDALEVFNGDVISGTMTGAGTDDLYKIELDPGEVLYVTLSGPGSTDFDLYAYENVLFWDEFIITGSASDTSSEAMTFVAWETEYYILDVYSYEGSGDYTMNVDIVDTISLDDGDNTMADAYPLQSEDTVSDAINEYYDQDDYYGVYVNGGEVLYAFLEVPVNVGVDFDLYIYDPNGNEIGSSLNEYGNEELSVYAETPGTYYVNVYAYSGIDVYSLYVETYSPPGADNNNDLVTAGSTYSGDYFSDTLNQFEDADDYFEIYVYDYETLAAELNGPADADFDLYIYDSNGNIMTYSNDAGSYEYLEYSPTYSGTYYVNPYAYEGFGQYTLAVSVLSSATLYADAGWDLVVGTGQTVSFDGTGSTGPISSYSWDFGDGSSGSGATATHSYSSTGTYTVYLTVSDGSTSSTDYITVTVQEASSMPNKYALVIGISDYQGDGDLNFCDEDADSWEAYLLANGYTVHTLIDDEADANGIYNEIDWLRAQEQAGDYVAFCFSGHGFYSDRARESGICAWNVEEEEGWIFDENLGQAFSDFESDHIFFFFDSCHSGGMDSVAGPGRYVSQTAGQLEYGLDAPKHEHGMWTYWFLEYGVKQLGNSNMVDAHDAAYQYAVNDAASGGNSMHPEEEFSGSSFYL